MLGFAIPALDLSAALQLVLTALAIVAGVLVFLKKAAPLYFFVDDENFDPSEDLETHRGISITGGATSMDACAVCRRPATKKCSRCKSLYYCSQVCQIEHWGSHKLNCKQASLANKDDVSPNTEACQRRKSSGFSSISLVPGRGTYKALEEPKKILFPYDEFVKLFNWDKQGFLPCGLLNCGNSCFANVVLQCLSCTRPLIAYLLEKDHHRGCVRKQHDWCFLCELQVHIQRASASLHPFSPINILSRLPNIGGNLGYGRQEDAHELLRFAVDTMQSICLDEFGGEKALDPSTQDTTLIQHIFGGHLQSQVICTKCNMISNRYENMMDLTIEIQGDAESLEECLNQFTIKEWLDGENMYKCDGCNDYVKAWKRLTIHQTPNILTIALKRFQSGRFGKLNKRVTFPETLDLTPYMSGIGDGTDVYSLYAVVVHVDMLNASFYGHYICYTKDYYGVWYRIDDCKVMKVEAEEVLSQGAYMLLYSRRTARRAPFVKPAEVAKKMNFTICQGALNVSMATEPIGVESAYCLPSNADVSLLRDTGHDRNFIIKSNSVTKKEPEDMDSEILSDEITPMSEDVEGVTSLKPTGYNSSTEAQALEMKPILKPKDLGGMDIDYSGPCSLGPKDLEEVKSSLPPPVDSSSLVEISSVVIEANEASSSHAGMHDIQTSMISSCSPSDPAAKRLNAVSCASESMV